MSGEEKEVKISPKQVEMADITPKNNQNMNNNSPNNNNDGKLVSPNLSDQAVSSSSETDEWERQTSLDQVQLQKGKTVLDVITDGIDAEFEKDTDDSLPTVSRHSIHFTNCIHPKDVQNNNDGSLALFNAVFTCCGADDVYFKKWGNRYYPLFIILIFIRFWIALVGLIFMGIMELLTWPIWLFTCFCCCREKPQPKEAWCSYYVQTVVHKPRYKVLSSKVKPIKGPLGCLRALCCVYGHGNAEEGTLSKCVGTIPTVLDDKLAV